MNRLFIFAAALSVGGGAASMVEAHHSFSMFDPSREEVVEGTVIRWAYNSPHTLLFIKDGTAKQWIFEGAAPPALLQRIPGDDWDNIRAGAARHGRPLPPPRWSQWWRHRPHRGGRWHRLQSV
jgi:plastocyanin